MAKRLVMEKSISVREAERHLDADAYLEYQWWVPWWASLRVPSPSDVSPCHYSWPEWVWMQDQLGQMGTVSRARPEGGKHYHGGSSALTLPGEQWRLPRGSHCKERDGGAPLPGCSGLHQKNASSVSSCSHCQRQSSNGDQPTPTDPTPRLTLLLCTMPPMSALPPHNGIHVKKL